MLSTFYLNTNFDVIFKSKTFGLQIALQEDLFVAKDNGCKILCEYVKMVPKESFCATQEKMIKLVFNPKFWPEKFVGLILSGCKNHLLHRTCEILPKAVEMHQTFKFYFSKCLKHIPNNGELDYLSYILQE